MQSGTVVVALPPRGIMGARGYSFVFSVGRRRDRNVQLLHTLSHSDQGRRRRSPATAALQRIPIVSVTMSRSNGGADGRVSSHASERSAHARAA